MLDCSAGVLINKTLSNNGDCPLENDVVEGNSVEFLLLQVSGFFNSIFFVAFMKYYFVASFPSDLH
jgi:hypothetical protein